MAIVARRQRQLLSRKKTNQLFELTIDQMINLQDHKKKKHKHNKRPETDSERDKRLVKEAKKFLKQKLRDGHPVNPPGSSLVPLAQTSSEPRPLPPGVETLSEEADYFVRNAEFSAWLSQDLGLYFK